MRGSMARRSGMRIMPIIPPPEPESPNVADLFLKTALNMVPTSEKVIIYTDKGGKKVRLNFDSPRTISASTRRGISFEECVRKYIRYIYTYRNRNEFFKKGIDDKISSLRYKHHLTRIQSIKYIYIYIYTL